MVRSSSLQRTASALASINLMPRMRSMGWSQVAGARNFVGSSIARMPARFPEGMPAFKDLKDEGMWVEPSNSGGGKSSSMTTLKVGIVNLMPLKEPTELQLLRMMARSTVMVDVTFICPDNYVGKNSTPGHLDSYYKRFSQIKDETYDGIILTGAPIEHLPFEEVGYWGELTAFLDRVRDKREGLLSLCWGAMATAYHFHGVPKHMTERKVFGCYSHDNMAVKEPMCHGLPLHIGIPVSRHTTWKKEDMQSRQGLKVLLESPESGPCCLWDPELVHVHMINHFEYDADTLHGEYLRDSEKGTPTGEPIHVPKDYYPNDDPSRTPLHKWESAGQVFYSNWLMTLLKKKVGA